MKKFLPKNCVLLQKGLVLGIYMTLSIFTKSDEYAPLPSRWELNKYEIMEEFVFSLEDSKMQEVLARAIRGKGAFGRFHTGIQAYKIQDQWYEYQKDRLREIAIEGCHQNRLAYKTMQDGIRQILT